MKNTLNIIRRPFLLPLLGMLFMLLVLAPPSALADDDIAGLGLWTGHVEILKVQELAANSSTSGELTPVDRSFTYTLLVHVDAEGQARLLKEVTVMGKEGADDEGQPTIEKVLVTDDDLLSNYEGIVRRDDELVGVRLGSLGYDFDPFENEGENQALMEGTLDHGQVLSVTLTLGANHPTNPFYHKYHPDHKTGREVGRTIRLTVDPENPGARPGEKGMELTGVYEENVSGLSKGTISMNGKFSLRRISLIGKLNE